jgi:hypothetical protein
MKVPPPSVLPFRPTEPVDCRALQAVFDTYGLDLTDVLIGAYDRENPVKVVAAECLLSRMAICSDERLHAYRNDGDNATRYRRHPLSVMQKIQKAFMQKVRDIKVLAHDDSSQASLDPSSQSPSVMLIPAEHPVMVRAAQFLNTSFQKLLLFQRTMSLPYLKQSSPKKPPPQDPIAALIRSAPKPTMDEGFRIGDSVYQGYVVQDWIEGFHQPKES